MVLLLLRSELSSFPIVEVCTMQLPLTERDVYFRQLVPYEGIDLYMFNHVLRLAKCGGQPFFQLQISMLATGSQPLKTKSCGTAAQPFRVDQSVFGRPDIGWSLVKLNIPLA